MLPKARRPLGRPKLEDVATIDSKLLSVALKEFIAHGYGASSLNQIVKAAGVSKTTLYSRFSSKEHLFREIMREEIKRLDAATILKPRGNLPELKEGLKAYANHMLELNLQGDLLAVNRLISSESHRFPELAAAAAERAELGIKRISNFIQECALVDGIPCKDSASVAEVFIFMLRGWHANEMTINQKVSASRREKWVSRSVNTLLAARADW
ncbi:TetR/AcrR family transcriptional regulator [Stenotrophobium rhamnosiphilum]|uniref:TetR/AcrR family transcriptional regulator n=1 Tax=Stenotrophobium rhamnosiphilum TaxID=2029166 RepID=UPI001375328A|nr:TetR/AcrR family transcriptional regulator [Stenotrophobium rhamnosiphilum]